MCEACPADWAHCVPAEPGVHAAEVEQVHAGQPPHPVTVPEIWAVTRHVKSVESQLTVIIPSWQITHVDESLSQPYKIDLLVASCKSFITSESTPMTLL